MTNRTFINPENEILYLECKRIVARFDINKLGLDRRGLRKYLIETLVQDGFNADNIPPQLLDKRVEIIFATYDMEETGLLELD